MAGVTAGADPGSAGSRRGLVMVMVDVEPEYEDEYNAWYDTEHLPERLRCPGILGARRFVNDEGSPRYVTVYELESLDVLDSDAYRAISPPGAWQQRLTPHLTAQRHVYREITRDVPEHEQVAAVRTPPQEQEPTP